MRGNGGGCFCAKVFCGFDGARVANFLDYLRQSFTRDASTARTLLLNRAAPHGSFMRGLTDRP